MGAGATKYGKSGGHQIIDSNFKSSEHSYAEETISKLVIEIMSKDLYGGVIFEINSSYRS